MWEENGGGGRESGKKERKKKTTVRKQKATAYITHKEPEYGRRGGQRSKLSELDANGTNEE